MTTSAGLGPATAVTAGGPGAGTGTVVDVTGGTKDGVHGWVDGWRFGKSEV